MLKFPKRIEDFTILVFIFVLAFAVTPSAAAFVNNEASTLHIGTSDISAIMNAQLNSPQSSTFDSAGNLWATDAFNNRIVMYPRPTGGFTSSANGEAATIVLGQPNLSTFGSNHGGVSANSLNGPVTILFDSAGNLWVTDQGNNRVLEYAAPISTGEAASVVIGQQDFHHNAANEGTTGNATSLVAPTSLAFDSSGNLWVADSGNNRVVMYPNHGTPSAPSFSIHEKATVVLGQDDLVSQSSSTTAKGLHFPVDLAFDSSGNLWVVDQSNNRVVQYPLPHGGFTPSSDGESATIVIGQHDFTHGAINAGSENPNANGLNSPAALIFDASGNLWVADFNNNRALMFPKGSGFTSSSDGEAATVVIGQPVLTSGSSNLSLSNPSANSLSGPASLDFDSTGNLWVTDSNNNRLVMFPQNSGFTSSSDGEAATIVIGQASFDTSSFANAASLNFPRYLAFDPSGNLWVADSGNNRILEYLKGSGFTNGEAASTVLGQQNFTSSSSNPTSSTSLNNPGGIVFDSSGNLWVTDVSDNRILEYLKGSGFTNGEAASTVLGQQNFITNQFAITATGLEQPTGLAFDILGNLWVADSSTPCRVLEYSKGSGFTNGQAASVVIGQPDFTTSGCSTSSTSFFIPFDLKFDSASNLWVVDNGNFNNRVLMFPNQGTQSSPSFSTNEAATMVLGQPDFTHHSGDEGGSVNGNGLDNPSGLAFDPSGNLWIADSNNNLVRGFLNLPPSTVEYLNTLVPGSNSITSGNFATTFTETGSWNDINFTIQQTDADPEIANNPATSVGKFFHVITNSPGILSSRTIQLTYTTSDLGSLDPASLQISRFSDGLWSTLSSTVNTVAKTVTATTPGFSTFVITGSPPITITSVVGADPLDRNAGYAKNDIITITFSASTNETGGTGVQSKSSVDNLFTFSQTLGTNANEYSGQWINPSTFVITINDATGGNPQIGVTTVHVNSAAKLGDAGNLFLVQTTASPALSGGFGTPPAPTITAFEVNDPNNGANTFHGEVSSSVAGDTFLITFSEDTNQTVGTVLTQSQIGHFFSFSPSLGTATYSGTWVTPSRFNMTIISAGNANPTIGTTTVTATNSAGFRIGNAASTSFPSTSTSPALSGTFGAFQVSIPVGNGGTATTTTPSGITVAVQTGSGSSGAITIAKTTAPTTGPSSSTIEFLGNILQISGQTCSVANPCTISFGFTTDDVNNANPPISFVNGIPQVKIFHAQEGASTFSNADELTPTVTKTSCDSNQICNFLATAQATHPSKFAIGGVVVLALLGAGSEANAPSPPSLSDGFASDEYPLTIDGNQFKLPNTTDLIPTVILQNSKPVEIKLLVSETGQGDDVEGMTLFTNLYGNDPTIANADTAIAYQEGSPLQIIDPHGFFKVANCTSSSVNGKFLFDFKIVFAKPMPTSDMAIRMWDKSMYTSNIVLINATKVDGTTSTVSENYTASKLLTTTISNEEQNLQIPFWIKNNAKWWHDGKLDDTMFLSGIQYLIDNKIIVIPHTEPLKANHSQVPAWVKNDAGWWSDGSVSDQEFIKALEFLVSQRIIKT